MEAMFGQETENAVSVPETAGKPRMSMEDFANSESSAWNNVAYDDHETQTQIMKETHQQMVGDGRVVQVSEETLGKVSQGFPDVRSKPRAERNTILKQAISTLKEDLRSVLKGLTGRPIEFDVNGNILEARLYSTGIREVLDNIGQAQADVLYTSENIFKNAQYLYSTPDKSGNQNIYRWNYFYTPVQISEDIVGVRIAVRDMVRGTDLKPESQIYHWGIKKDTSLDDGSRGPKVASSGVSSDVSITDTTIPQPTDFVNSTPETQESGHTNTVGAAQAGFQTPDSVSQERTSNLDSGAAVFTGREGEATGLDRADYDSLFRYQTETEEQRRQYATNLLYYAKDGKRVFLGDIDPEGYQQLVDYLKNAPAWNGIMTDTAMLIKQEMQGRALADPMLYRPASGYSDT